MRARALHSDVLVVTSSLLQVNCVLVRAGEPASTPEREDPERAETFVIDSPVLPEELQALRGLLGQAHFPPASGLLVTHGDWDHLLGRLAFAELAIGCAESTARRLAERPGEAQRALRAFDEELAIERPAPLSLGAPQALPVPGRLSIADRELELHPTEGHTADGMAVLVGWAGVLVAGDYLSPIEIPILQAGAEIEAYLLTLEGLRGLLERAEQLVPGHGPTIDRARALELLDEDAAYLRALGEGGDAKLPAGRDRAAQRRLHAANQRALQQGAS